jgi:hypothetical protein
MQWLRGIANDVIDSAEIGVDRLEDLYQLLLRDDLPLRDDGGEA